MNLHVAYLDVDRRANENFERDERVVETESWRRVQHQTSVLAVPRHSVKRQAKLYRRRRSVCRRGRRRRMQARASLVAKQRRVLERLAVRRRRRIYVGVQRWS